MVPLRSVGKASPRQEENPGPILGPWTFFALKIIIHYSTLSSEVNIQFICCVFLDMKKDFER